MPGRSSSGGGGWAPSCVTARRRQSPTANAQVRSLAASTPTRLWDVKRGVDEVRRRRERLGAPRSLVRELVPTLPFVLVRWRLPHCCKERHAIGKAGRGQQQQRGVGCRSGGQRHLGTSSPRTVVRRRRSLLVELDGVLITSPNACVQANEDDAINVMRNVSESADARLAPGRMS